MSLKRRDSPFANAALVVTVEPRDYLGRFGDGPLAGVELQRAIERNGFDAGGGRFVAPAQRVTDFVARRATTAPLASSYRPRVAGGDVRGALPPFVGDALERALGRVRPHHGRASTAPRRSSSASRRAPARRCASCATRRWRRRRTAGSIPAGEGAGYAGGIVSAAVDGMRVADAVLAAL